MWYWEKTLPLLGFSANHSKHVYLDWNYDVSGTQIEPWTQTVLEPHGENDQDTRAMRPQKIGWAVIVRNVSTACLLARSLGIGNQKKTIEIAACSSVMLISANDVSKTEHQFSLSNPKHIVLSMHQTYTVLDFINRREVSAVSKHCLSTYMFISGQICSHSDCNRLWRRTSKTRINQNQSIFLLKSPSSGCMFPSGQDELMFYFGGAQLSNPMITQKCKDIIDKQRSHRHP